MRIKYYRLSGPVRDSGSGAGSRFSVGRSRDALSLVEVTMAMGILAFAFTAIFGLFSVGLQASQDSAARVQAANLAGDILNPRLRAPTADLENASGQSALLPKFTPAFVDGLREGYSSKAEDTEGTLVGASGFKTSEANAKYRAFYWLWREPGNSTTGSGAGLVRVRLVLTWPPEASGIAAAAGAYEIHSSIFVDGSQ